MNHGKVLKRAWEILWRYRVLWIFGVIVALTAPLYFLGGLAHVFKSSVWTLTYRGLRAVEGSEA